jgi:hypothetical protein
MKSFYAAAVMNPNPNRHNHVGYAESFIKAAESLGHKLVLQHEPTMPSGPPNASGLRCHS